MIPIKINGVIILGLLIAFSCQNEEEGAKNNDVRSNEKEIIDLTKALEVLSENDSIFKIPHLNPEVRIPESEDSIVWIDNIP